MRTGDLAGKGGFTLIELVVAIAILAILAAIAVPSYQNHIDRTHRTVAQAALAKLLSQQQQSAISRRGSASTSLPTFNLLTGINGNVICLDKAGRFQACTAAGGLYRLEIINAPDGSWNGFSAVAIGVQVRDKKCQSLTITRNGGQSARDLGGEDSTRECWR